MIRSQKKWDCKFQVVFWRYKGIVEILTDTLNKTGFEINQICHQNIIMEDLQQITLSVNVTDLQMEFSGLFLRYFLSHSSIFYAFIMWRFCIETVTTCTACTTGLTKPWRCLCYCTDTYRDAKKEWLSTEHPWKTNPLSLSVECEGWKALQRQRKYFSLLWRW